MKREIKFRFFRKDPSPKMIYPEGSFFLTHVGAPVVISHYSSGRIEANLADLIPLQYTGLKDKNGKEIYEGDILRTDNVEIEYVEYFPAYASFCRVYQNHVYEINDNGNYEVIGNIYENPELLRQSFNSQENT